MITYWVLWFVITISEGHLRHFPVETQYPTHAACEADIAELTAVLKEQFPGDTNTRAYCQEFPPPTKERISHGESDSRIPG